MNSFLLIVAFVAAVTLGDSLPQPWRAWLDLTVKYDGAIADIVSDSCSLLSSQSSTASIDDNHNEHADCSSQTSTTSTGHVSRPSLTSSLLQSGNGSSDATSEYLPGPVVNDYPEKYQQHCGEIDQWLLTSCQCVSFVAWRISSRLGVDFSRAFDSETWSNANTWANAAYDAGIPVNDIPTPGAIAQTNAGKYGHVAWVAAVSGENVRLEEYNALKPLAYDTRVVSASDFQYIHIPLNQDAMGYRNDSVLIKSSSQRMPCCAPTATTFAWTSSVRLSPIRAQQALSTTVKTSTQKS